VIIFKVNQHTTHDDDLLPLIAECVPYKEYSIEKFIMKGINFEIFVFF